MDRKTNNILKDMKRNRQDIDTIQSSQFIGADSIIAYKTNSDEQFDHSITMSSSGQVINLLLTFTHQTATAGALLDLKLFYRINNPDVMAQPVPMWLPSMPAIYVRWYKVMPIGNGQVTQWRIRCVKNANSTTFTGYFKFFIDGTDTGQWSISVI